MKNVVLKVSNYIQKHNNIFVVMLFFISIFGITLDVIFDNSDELWNFQNIYKMYNGYQIYKDANVIITPLFFWIGEILFKILGANIFVFRIYNIIIILTLLFITYLLLKKLKIGKRVSIIIILTLIILKKYCIITQQANYNTMALLFYILGVYISLKQCKYNNIIQGIILFLIFSSKQNIGVFYAIGLLINELIIQKNTKQKIKNIIIEFFTFYILLLLMLTYLYINNNLYDFINYAFLGINEFAENIYIYISNLMLSIFFIGANISLTLIFIKNKKINNIEKQNLLILNSFSVPLTLIMIPILNDAHFIMGIYLSIIEFAYIAEIFLREVGIKINKKIINSIVIIFSILMCMTSIYYFINWIKTIKSDDYLFEKENPFYGAKCDEEFTNNIKIITEYIKNNQNNVIVLSNKAALYMVPLKRSNGMLDLPFKGNLGKDGEEELIQIIKNLKNTEILIEKQEDNIFWQESKKVREYIMKNLDKIGEIEEFDIYY